MFRLIKRSPWIALGAAAAWFFDPRSGNERRQQALSKLEDLKGSASNGSTSTPSALRSNDAAPSNSGSSSSYATG